MTVHTDEHWTALCGWVYALTRIEPGDFATSRNESEAEIRARNRACTPVNVWHFAPEFAGANNGETGV